MADRVINVTVSNVNTKNVTVSSKQVANEISATADSSVYYSQLAKNWAIGEGLIQNEDYSSKTYAGVAQEAAENAQGSADTAQAFVNDFSGVVDNAITEIDGVKTEALTAVTSSKDLALRDISATQSSALTEIGDLKNSSLTEISASSTTVLSDINNVGQNYIDNINATGKGFDNLTQRQITNCLLEVPQRIKYDLTDGVLTIKKGSQVIVPYGNHERDIIVAGSPTITSDGVASNFSSSNYIELKQTFTTLKSGSEIVFNATLTGGADQRIICFNSYTLHFGVNASNIVKIWISSTGTSWDIANGTTGKTTLSDNVNYYFKISFTGTAYKVDISTDGVTYNNEITINSSSQVYTLGKAMISNYPSGSGASATGYWRGSIDLNKSYIKNGSDIVWSGADKVLEKYPVGSTFLNANFKVADTQYADGKFFVWAELVEDAVSNGAIDDTNERNVCFNMQSGKFQIVVNAGSGSTAPTGSSTNNIWYNTTDNIIKRYNGTELSDDNIRSFVFMRVIANGVTTTGSVTQVFNGMGYIGSTYWIDKGVKGLFPNGRNKDGSLKNIEHTQNKLLIATVPSNITKDYSFVMDNENGTAVGLYPSVDEVPSTAISGTTWLLHKSSNLTYQWDGNGYALKVHSVTGEYMPIIDIGRATFTNGVISNFQPKQPFHAPDIQDVVRKTGDTMSGHLEFEGTASIGLFGGAVYTHAMDMALDDKPSGDKFYAVIQHEDKNMVRKSRLESYWATDGSHGVLISEKKNASTNSYAKLLVGFDANGNAYTYAPHSSYTNSIVTQAGIKKAGNGYVKFGNGLIIQWGTVKTTSDTSATWTFATAFTSTNYRVVSNYLLAEDGNYSSTVSNKSTTNCKIWANNKTVECIAIGY